MVWAGKLFVVPNRRTNGDCTAQAGLWGYAKNFTYNAARAVTSMQLGNNPSESTQFNLRLKPTQIALRTVVVCAMVILRPRLIGVR